MATPGSARPRAAGRRTPGGDECSGNLAHPAGAAEPTLLLTRRDLARELRCSVREVDRLRSRGMLPAPIRLGRAPRWRREDVVAWLCEVRP